MSCKRDNNQTSDLNHTLLAIDSALKQLSGAPPIPDMQRQPVSSSSRPRPFAVPRSLSNIFSESPSLSRCCPPNADSIHLLIPLKAHQVCSTFLIHQLMSKLGFDASACAKLLLNPSTYVFGASLLEWDFLSSYLFSL